MVLAGHQQRNGLIDKSAVNREIRIGCEYLCSGVQLAEPDQRGVSQRHRLISIGPHQLLNPPGLNFQLEPHADCATANPLDEDPWIQPMPAQQMSRFR